MTPRSPLDISQITENLFIAARPRTHHVEELRGMRIDLVISMIWWAPPAELARPPFRLVRLPTFDNPALPIPLWALRRGVSAALPVIDAGGRVLVYCRAGRHRSVAQACCILIAEGMTAEQAMQLVTQHRHKADPHAWYIERRIRAFERDWLRRKLPATGSVRASASDGATPSDELDHEHHDRDDSGRSA